MEALIPLLAQFKDAAIVIPCLGCIGLGYLHVVWRREEREDRKASMEVLNKVIEAMNGVRVALAAKTGQVP